MEGTDTLLIDPQGRSWLKTTEKLTHEQAGNKALSGSGHVSVLISSSCPWVPVT